MMEGGLKMSKKTILRESMPLLPESYSCCVDLII